MEGKHWFHSEIGCLLIFFGGIALLVAIIFIGRSIVHDPENIRITPVPQAETITPRSTRCWVDFYRGIVCAPIGGQ